MRYSMINPSMVIDYPGGETVVQAVIAMLALIVIIVMSVRSNTRFSNEQRLPMQWSFGGAVNWTAPRSLALSFTPILAAIVLSAATIGTLVSTPRPGQEGLKIPVIILLSLGLIGAHALHLWLIDRTIRANDR